VGNDAEVKNKIFIRTQRKRKRIMPKTGNGLPHPLLKKGYRKKGAEVRRETKSFSSKA